MPRILIDTSAIYAFVARTDVNHPRAVEFVKAARRQRSVFILPDLVFAETMTLLKARLGAGVAVRVGEELRSNPAYLWSPLTENAERDTWATFQQYVDKAWSYTDCALLVAARRVAVSQVFSFDRHFDQMPGVQRVPTSPTAGSTP
jgi:uncharacterized protein